MLENDLSNAIDDLYLAFSGHHLKSRTTGCPCCVSESDIALLHGKTLRNLDGNDLSKYTFKAMTTWGTDEDFKHFLPRILELFATGGLGVDTSVVLGKLNYGGWDKWTEAEKNAVIRVLMASWANRIKNYRFNLDELIWTSRYTDRMDELLSEWPLEKDSRGFENFVLLISDYYYDLAGDGREFIDMSYESTKKLKQWIKANISLLEERFFYHVEKDKAFAEKISEAQYKCEWTKL